MTAADYDKIAGVSANVARALAWLDTITDEEGGVHRWLRSDTGELATVSLEITAYALHLFTWLGRVFPSEVFSERADIHARYLSKWLVRAAEQLPGFEPNSTLSYFFDCGIVARALRFYGSYAAEYGECLANKMAAFVSPDSLIEPVMNVAGYPLVQQKRWWSTRPGLYQLKAALAWQGLPEHKLLTATLNSSITIADMPDSDEAAFDALHPFAYYVEGLTLAAHAYRANIQRGRLGSHLKQAPYYRTDAVAQYARLAIMASLEPTESMNRLKALQRPGGGFAFSNRPGEVYLTSHGTMFAIQALIMAEIGPTPELGVFQIV